MTVYRGVPNRDSVAQNYIEGSPVMFNAWTSTSTDVNRAQGFATEKGVILKIKVFTGKDIRNISMCEFENEILLTPKHRFQVTWGMYQDGNYSYVDLMETRQGCLE